MKFSDNCITLFLKLLKKFPDREISGRLSLDENNHFNLTQPLVFYENGLVDGVTLMPGTYSFHTHPESAYLKYDVSVGFPSGLDFAAFLDHAVNEGAILHCVVALEGIYIIMMNENVDKYRLYTHYLEDVKNTFDLSKKDTSIREFLTTINSTKIFKVKFRKWL